jgi:hypothetical protein
MMIRHQRAIAACLAGAFAELGIILIAKRGLCMTNVNNSVAITLGVACIILGTALLYYAIKR